jgi:hypothetical protein
MTDKEVDDTTAMSRRKMLGGAVIIGGAVAGGAVAGAVGASATDSASGIRREKMIIDVACDGNTFREQSFPEPPDPGDRRGSPFSVEGWIYPEGTVADGFQISPDGSIGRWFCAGFNILSAERPEPHINATADFVFGEISQEQLFPPDIIVTHGLGGSGDETQVSSLPVIGGTGRYLGALGVAARRNVGKNNTSLFELGSPSPNFRYEFDLILVG